MHGLLKPVQEQDPVWQVGQEIVHGCVFELFFSLLTRQQLLLGTLIEFGVFKGDDRLVCQQTGNDNLLGFIRFLGLIVYLDKANWIVLDDVLLAILIYG